MNSIQLSMFSDNMPDKALEEIHNNKQGKNTGTLDKNPSENSGLAESLTRLNDTESTKRNSDEIKPVESGPLSINNDINSAMIKPSVFNKNKKGNPIALAELSEEDIAVQNIDTEIKKKDTLTDKERLEYFEKIRAIGLGCHKCILSEKRTKVVFGSGNPEAQIMIIGEGPGEQEDKTGIPFVGKAGQLLDKIMESAHIQRDTDVYITNVVKCRPPENRTPLQDEVEACSVYLEKQLELAKASIILLTGATAMKAILNSSSSISKVRGEWIEWKGKWVMPIFHPSYLLRNQSKEVGSPKWLMWQDIKKVKLKFDELKGK